MSSDWKPIEIDEFKLLYESQYSELSTEQKSKFDRWKTDISTANLKRSDLYGNEKVFVVAKNEDGILYFDDVEYGFNIGVVNEENLIMDPGGSQDTLAEAIDEWL